MLNIYYYDFIPYATLTSEEITFMIIHVFVRPASKTFVSFNVNIFPYSWYHQDFIEAAKMAIVTDIMVVLLST
jgi:hypothetical protein